MPLYDLNSKKIIKTAIAAFVLILAITVYIFTLAPGIHLEDSAEFATATATLGIAHPPGFPFYLLLGHIFIKLIPFGSIALRLNLATAFFSSTTVAVLFLVILETFNIYQSKIKTRFFYRLLLAFSCSLAFAFSFTFWSQSVVAEVYSLNTFFVIVMILILLKIKLLSNIDRPKSMKYILLLCFICGLSLCNHTMIALLIPIFLCFLILAFKPKSNIFFKRHIYKFIVLCLILFILGLSFYLYLPIRSVANPSLDWGNPENIENFWRHISRFQYEDFEFSFNAGKLLLIQAFFSNLTIEFSWLLAVFGLIGLVYTIILSRELALLLVGIFFLNSIAIILLRNFTWGVGVESIYSVYYLPCYLCFSISLALVFNFLIFNLEKFTGKLKFIYKKIIFIAIAFFILFIPFNLFLNNFSVNNQSDFKLVHDWAFESLNSLPKDAVLIAKGYGVTGDAQSFSLAYMHLAENLRPDVTIIDDCHVFGQPVGWQLPLKYFELDFISQLNFMVDYFHKYSSLYERPLYSTFPLENDNFSFRSNGLIYQIFKQNDLPLKLKNIYTSELQLGNTNHYSTTAKDFLASYYYSRSSAFLERDQDLYLDYFLQAIEYDQEPMSLEYQQFIRHRSGLFNYK